MKIQRHYETFQQFVYGGLRFRILLCGAEELGEGLPLDAMF